ncbi:hypothetical protein [Bacteroides cellulosilyticus]|uniref:hypothetical protein n=1 Tax=Bacteroides cellulosilyticus TaxID=246787 RepID=UPI0022E1A3D8|nr:hypothetical protein [Bacteroides cellulosilyticus]
MILLLSGSDKSVQEPVWQYLSAFSLYPTRLRLPVSVCLMKKVNGCSCDALNRLIPK